MRRRLLAVGFVVGMALAAHGSGAVAPLVWQATGPEGGYVWSFATPQQPGTVYATTADGVYKSTNWGGAWARRSRDFRLIAVAVHPQNPRIVYAGGDSFWRSTNGGQTWRRLAATIYPNVILVAPSTPRTVYAWAPLWLREPLLRSDDGGISWVRVKEHLVGFDLLVDPFAAKRLYLRGAYGPYAVSGVWRADRRGVWVSRDGGVSWRRTLRARVGAVAVDPAARGVVYAGDEDGTMRRSLDGGRSWGVVGRVSAPGVSSLVVDPAAPGTLWAGSRSGVHRSTDGGRTWRLRGGWPSGERGPYGGFLSGNRLVVDPTGSGRLLLAGSAKVFRSLDAGASWRPAARGMIATHIAGLDARFAGRVYASDGSRVHTSTNGGRTWRVVGEIENVWGTRPLVVDPRRASRVYAGGLRLVRSTDGGHSWTRLGSFSNVNAIAVDPARSRTLYVGTGLLWGVDAKGGFFRSNDGGVTWRRASWGLGDRPVGVLAADPARSGTLYAGVREGRNGVVLKTEDGGESWFELSFPLYSFEVPSWPVIDEVRSIAVDPHDTDVVFVASGRWLYRSEDGGLTWTTLRRVARTYWTSVVADPVRPGVIYAASPTSVLVSDDRGDSWRRVGGPLRGTIRTMSVDARGTRLLVGTESRGVYVARLPLLAG